MSSCDPTEPHDVEPADCAPAWPPSVLRRAVADTAARVRNGLPLYPLLWAVLMPTEGFASRHRAFTYGHGIAMAVLLVVRWHHHLNLPRALERDWIRARAVFRALSLGQNLYWGVLTALVVTTPDAGLLRWLMFVVTVGMATAGAVVVASDLALSPSIPAVMLGPTALAVALQGASGSTAQVVLCGVCFVYSISTSRVVQRDYWSTQRAHLLLEQRARALETLSRTDALTRIPNRLRFEEHLRQTWRDARRRREPMAVAVVDLDHFKRVNDTHGHPFGDLCLQAAAQALASSVHRPADLVARYGGEEFVVLMPNTDLEGARMVARRLLARVAAISVTQGSRRVVLSCSVGVASMTPDATTEMEQLVQLADRALYRAKQEGRARVVSLTESGTTRRAVTSPAE